MEPVTKTCWFDYLQELVDKETMQDEFNIYPLTVIKDRYSGTYSGGIYLAFNLESSEIPPEIHASDLDCKTFWDNTNLVVGKGSTYFSAIMDLKEKLHNE